MNHQTVRGSISLFLVLILMPLFSGTYLAIDAGRASAARSRLESALNLTGNAALNDYDEALKDWYGLFAMAKSQEAYERELTAVFSGTIDAGETTGDGSFDNYINTGTKDFSVSFPSDASLARPAVLERTVTGYMKYRGPYRFARGVSQRIGAFQHIREASDALSKSQDYYDDLSGVSKQLTKLADALPAEAEGFDAGAQESAVKSILGGLDKLSSQVKKTDRSADAWKNSLDQMPEGEARSLLAGDYKATAGVLNEEGVSALRDKLNADLTAIDDYNAAKKKAGEDRKAAEEALKAAEEAVAAGGEAPQGLIDPASIKDPEPPSLSYRNDALYGYIAGSRTKDSSDPEK
ncbi:MAG: Tad domain-containing protein, partial [Clostridia bacterium]|nr:Tad domain-containing protein [Clostridia bacterium]